MKWSDYSLAFLASVLLHVTLLVRLGSFQEAQALFESGASAVVVNLVPSVASRAAAPPAPARTATPEAGPDAAPPQRDPVDETPPETLTEVEPSDDAPVSPPEEEQVHAPAERPEAIRFPVEALERRLARVRQAYSQALRDVLRFRPEEAVHAVARAETARERGPQGEAGETDEALARVDEATASVNARDANGDVRRKGVASPAAARNMPTPVYPRYSRRHGEEGRVVVEVEVRADGSTGMINIVESSGNVRLDRAALRALEQASFVAARMAGRAVASTKRFTFTFRLEGSEVVR